MSYSILIVDDEENFRVNAQIFLKARGYETYGAATLAEARESLRKGNGDIVLLDVRLPDGYGPDLLQEITAQPQSPPVIIMTAYGDIDMAVDAMRNGAHDFFTKKIDFAALEKSLARACELVAMRRELMHIHETRKKAVNFVMGKSQAQLTQLSYAQKAAEVGVSVLITGETGTGKEVMANFIHTSGKRADKPMIAINCGAIQGDLIESELFGYEAGAFTGADKLKRGLMELADGGILFLDEISSMSLDMQAKLLRALGERAFRRVGGEKLVKVDVQVVAASNRDLPTMIREGQFREDLYYRLKVVDLHTLPLRERREDIPDLVGFYVRQFNRNMGASVTGVTDRAMQALCAYRWPGNIRELSNAIERAMLFCDGETIDLPDLSPEMVGNG